MVEEMQDNRDGYDGGGDVGRKHIICGTTEIAEWVVRTTTNWASTNTEQLPT